MRNKISKYLLKRKIKKLNIKTVSCNLNQAKKVGLIYNAHNINNINALREIEKFYLDKKIDVETLGFAHTKHLSDMLIGNAKHHYVCLQDFDFFFLPKKHLIDSFLNNKFDILINLYTHNHYTLESLVCLSKAKFKVGSAHLNSQMHDLMIDVGDKKEDINYLSTQINHYLSILNT